MRRMVRPVWVALAGTPLPADIKERCRRSFEDIRQYFLRGVGRTFQVAELQFIRTHLTAEHFQERQRGRTPLPKDLDQLGQERGGPEYYSKLPDEEIFCLNLTVFVRERLGTDNNQAWVILVPAVAVGSFGGTYAAIRIGSGGYIIASTYPFHPGLSSERPKIRIAHELGHVFGLDHNREVPHGLMNDQGLLYDQDPMLANCTLNQKERWILLRSPFFTVEE